MRTEDCSDKEREEEDMEEKIYDILSEIRPECDYRSSEDYLGDEILDSYDVIELVTKLEEIFHCSISGLDILPQNFSTMKGIISMVEKSGGTL